MTLFARLIDWCLLSWWWDRWADRLTADTEARWEMFAAWWWDQWPGGDETAAP